MNKSKNNIIQLFTRLDIVATEYQCKMRELTDAKKVSCNVVINLHDIFVDAQDVFIFFLALQLGISRTNFLSGGSRNVDKALRCTLREDLKAFLKHWMQGFTEPTNQMFRDIDIRKEKDPDYTAWYLLYKIKKSIFDISRRLFLEVYKGYEICLTIENLNLKNIKKI